MCKKLLIIPLHYIERLLPLPTVRDQSLPVVEILDARQRSARGAEIHQNPRTGAAQERDSFQHTHLMLVEVLLIFLSPSRQSVAVFTIERVAAEFTHDERLLIHSLPFYSVSLFRQTVVPAHVLVTAQHVEVLAERVIYHLRLLAN